MKRDDIIKSPLFWITLSLPVVLACTVGILPTFDDWTSTPAPNPDDFTWQLLLPRVSYWRPLESLYGWCLGHYRWLMPWFGHVIVIIGHYVGCIMLYLVASRLGMGTVARNVATLSLWVATGAIATTTACDGMSQTWVHTLGMIALYVYLTSRERGSYSWLVIVALATIVKENAVCWGIAIPVIGYGFGLTDRRDAVKQIAWALLFGVCYSVIHFAMPTAADYQLEEDYFDFSVVRILRGIALWLTYSLLPLDYIHLLYAPQRNLLYVALSAIAVIPFVIVLMAQRRGALINSKILSLMMASAILAGPHLVTIFSLMHVYSSIGMIALLFGCLADTVVRKKALYVFFGMYVVTSVVVNAEHSKAAYDAGLHGKEIAVKAVNSVKGTVERAFVLSIDNGEVRYSNFYVLPLDCIGWGRAMLWETDYQWPKHMSSMTIEGGDASRRRNVIDSLLYKADYDCVWILENGGVRTVNR